jgi:hypothetical protein
MNRDFSRRLAEKCIKGKKGKKGVAWRSASEDGTCWSSCPQYPQNLPS